MNNTIIENLFYNTLLILFTVEKKKIIFNKKIMDYDLKT